MNQMLLKIFYLALFCYLLIAILLYVFQRQFLYFPTTTYEHSFERMSLSSQGEALEIIVLNKGNDEALIYFGGNAEAVVANGQEFSSNFSDVTTYLVNYRGYGGSSGKPTEVGNYADALTIYDKVKESHTDISVAGRSLGSGVATYLAANRRIENVILITPYDSILSLAKKQYSIFPIKFLLKDHYDSMSRVKDIKSKVLVITAESDQVIPMSHTQNLIKEFQNDQVSLKVIKGAGHNNLSNSSDYYKVIRDFL